MPALDSDAPDSGQPVSGPGVPSSLALNTVAQSASRMTGYVLSFASAPVILSGLGLRAFGIWAVTGALAQYGALLDLGAGISLARYIAAGEDDRRVCGEYMAVAIGAVLGIVIVLGGLSILLAGFLSHAIGGISSADMRTVLLCSVSLLCCSMLVSVIAAYPIGRRRMVAPNVGITLAALVNFIFSVGSIALGAKLIGYALANAIAAPIGVLLVGGIVVRTEGWLPIARPSGPRLRRFLAYSTKNQIVRVMDLVNYQTDKLVIGFSIGVSAAGAYELGNRVAIAVRQVGIYATSAMDIELTSLGARFGLDRVRARYGRFTSFAATFGFPPVLLAIATAPLLMRAWLAHVPPNATAVLVALSAAYLVAVSTSVGYGVAVAAGEPGLVARTAVGTAVANIILTASLAPFLGIWGVLSGTVVALTVGAIAQVIYVHRRFRLPAQAYLQAVLPALRWFGLFAIPVAAISYSPLIHGRLASAAATILLSVAYLAACGSWAARAGRLPSVLAKKLSRFPVLSSVSLPARNERAGNPGD